jgi:hypothetical protein
LSCVLPFLKKHLYRVHGLKGNSGVSNAAQSKQLQDNKKSRAASIETMIARSQMRSLRKVVGELISADAQHTRSAQVL